MLAPHNVRVEYELPMKVERKAEVEEEEQVPEVLIHEVERVRYESTRLTAVLLLPCIVYHPWDCPSYACAYQVQCYQIESMLARVESTQEE